VGELRENLAIFLIPKRDQLMFAHSDDVSLSKVRKEVLGTKFHVRMQVADEAFTAILEESDLKKLQRFSGASL
jgi:hypothetical protein